MALILDALVEILRQPTAAGVVSELMLFCGPLWVAVLVGLLVGWAWRPRWAALLVGGEEGRSDGNNSQLQSCSSEVSEGSGLGLGLPSLHSLKAQLPSCITYLISEERTEKVEDVLALSPPDEGGERLAVTTEDLEYLSQLVELTDGGPAWQQMMDRSLPNMSYQAWQRDRESGPPQYRSRSVFEDATPDIVRDFFWDDEFRMKGKWDDMLIHHRTLEECQKTGTMIVHWVRKFPFFCSNREYIIGRRIWESEGAFYCVTKECFLMFFIVYPSSYFSTLLYQAASGEAKKQLCINFFCSYVTPDGVPYPSLPRQNKPRRVDLYYSSWCIRPVESRRGDGQLTATEVLLFHYEDMGIPWEIAKLGIRQGMWGLVKRIEPGLRAYQMARRTDEPHSRCAPMALVNTKVSANFLRSLETNNDSSEIEEPQKDKGRSIPKFLVIGGAVVLACTLDRGLLTKALIFGVARRFAKLGR